MPQQPKSNTPTKRPPAAENAAPAAQQQPLKKTTTPRAGVPSRHPAAVDARRDRATTELAQEKRATTLFSTATGERSANPPQGEIQTREKEKREAAENTRMQEELLRDVSEKFQIAKQKVDSANSAYRALLTKRASLQKSQPERTTPTVIAQSTTKAKKQKASGQTKDKAHDAPKKTIGPKNLRLTERLADQKKLFDSNESKTSKKNHKALARRKSTVETIIDGAQSCIRAIRAADKALDVALRLSAVAASPELETLQNILIELIDSINPNNADECEKAADDLVRAFKDAQKRAEQETAANQQRVHEAAARTTIEDDEAQQRQGIESHEATGYAVLEQQLLHIMQLKKEEEARKIIHGAEEKGAAFIEASEVVGRAAGALERAKEKFGTDAEGQGFQTRIEALRTQLSGGAETPVATSQAVTTGANELIEEIHKALEAAEKEETEAAKIALAAKQEEQARQKAFLEALQQEEKERAALLAKEKASREESELEARDQLNRQVAAAAASRPLTPHEDYRPIIQQPRGSSFYDDYATLNEKKDIEILSANELAESYGHERNGELPEEPQDNKSSLFVPKMNDGGNPRISRHEGITRFELEVTEPGEKSDEIKKRKRDVTVTREAKGENKDRTVEWNANIDDWKEKCECIARQSFMFRLAEHEILTRKIGLMQTPSSEETQKKPSDDSDKTISLEALKLLQKNFNPRVIEIEVDDAAEPMTYKLCRENEENENKTTSFKATNKQLDALKAHLKYYDRVIFKDIEFHKGDILKRETERDLDYSSSKYHSSSSSFFKKVGPLKKEKHPPTEEIHGSDIDSTRSPRN